MKYLRLTMWLGRTAAPMTTIIPADQLTMSIYAAATHYRQLNQTLPGPPVEVEVHEYPDELGVTEATLQIIQSRPEPLDQQTAHEHTTLDWAMDLLDTLTPGGVAQTTKPAPLDTETLVRLLTRVASAPEYNGQRINMTARDLTEVSLVDGAVITGKPS